MLIGKINPGDVFLLNGIPHLRIIISTNNHIIVTTGLLVRQTVINPSINLLTNELVSIPRGYSKVVKISSLSDNLKNETTSNL